MNKNTKKRRRYTPVLIIIFLFIISGGYMSYHCIYGPNISTQGEAVELYIPDNATFEYVFSVLKQKELLIHPQTFIWVANLKKYPQHIKGGKYLVKDGMSNNTLLNDLRSGSQIPVRITFSNARTKEDLAGKICSNLSIDSTELLQLLNNKTFLQEFQLTPQTSVAIFIPNTYEVYWNTSAENLFRKMYAQFNAYWNAERKLKAKNINLTPIQVSTLASIVEEETHLSSEKPIIAGLYLNRLKRGMLLQADPTLKFVINDFTIQRVLNAYKEIDSPYNTYMYKGLPPGPIRIPSKEGLEAVLNRTQHDYLFMCANADFSGRHAFARTLAEHNANALAFQAEMNKRKIYK